MIAPHWGNQDTSIQFGYGVCPAGKLTESGKFQGEAIGPEPLTGNSVHVRQIHLAVTVEIGASAPPGPDAIGLHPMLGHLP